jgi:hypothetical protein
MSVPVKKNESSFVGLNKNSPPTGIIPVINDVIGPVDVCAEFN